MNENQQAVLDASCLIVLISKEPGWENVLPLLPRAVMSSVNIAEVAKFLIEKKNMPKDVIKVVIEKLVAEIVSFDSEQAYISAELVLNTKEYGLSLGDRACLSLALMRDVVSYTADKVWAKVKLQGLEIELIR